jgi:hypothetical protein
MKNEILCVETKAGLFEPAPRPAKLRRQKRDAAKRKQDREELCLLILGVLAVIGFTALGAWQGHLMMSG